MIIPQRHTGSYYAASVNQATNFPQLNGEKSVDVCVIGAGFTGVSTALHLVERGYKVALVEANKVGWGASGRNGGQMIGGISGEKRIAKNLGQDVEEVFSELRWEGHRIIQDRITKYDIECDFKLGYLDVAIQKKHMKDIDYDYERLKKANFPYEVRVLSREETAEMIGTQAYIGALLNRGNGHLHPLNLCVGEAHAAAALGVDIFEQSPVLEIKHGRQAKVVCKSGSIKADSVVLAGNAYHLLEKKLRGIMFPVNSFLIATEPLSPELVAQINPQDLAVCDPNFILEYFRLTADKRLLFGSRINYFGNDPNYICKKLTLKMKRIYPQLSDIRIDYAWGGTIGVPINRVPQLGKISGNVFYCQGYSGHGVNVTHLAGRIMADAVAGTMEQFDLFADVKPFTVPGAHALAKPMVALGVMYYKIKDRL